VEVGRSLIGERCAEEGASPCGKGPRDQVANPPREGRDRATDSGPQSSPFYFPFQLLLLKARQELGHDA